MAMTMEEKIIAILSEQCGAEDGEIGGDTELFEEGLLDSFGVIQLLVSLEEAFGIALEISDLSRSEISTPMKIAALLREAQR